MNNSAPVIVWQWAEKGSVKGYPNLRPWHKVRTFMYLPRTLNPNQASQREIQHVLEKNFGRGTYKITWVGQEIYRTPESRILL